jgi:transposase
MLTLPSSVRVYMAAESTDMRRSFDRLAATVEGVFGFDITEGHIFVFINRRADQAKCLFWDRTGLCVLHKRLEVGTFRRVCDADSGAQHVEIDAAELSLMLEGIDLAGAKRKKRFRRGPRERELHELVEHSPEIS